MLGDKDAGNQAGVTGGGAGPSGAPLATLAMQHTLADGNLAGQCAMSMYLGSVTV